MVVGNWRITRKDVPSKGAVLLVEFCEWIKMKEIQMNTDFGKVLALDADQERRTQAGGIQKRTREKYGRR